MEELRAKSLRDSRDGPGFEAQRRSDWRARQRCPWVAGGRQLETRTVPRRHNTRPPRTAPGHFQYKTRPARVVQPHSRYKTRPAHSSSPHTRYKTRPARPKWPNLARFSRAWRTFYRFHQQEAAHGELCTACEAETGLAITAHQPSPARRAPQGQEDQAAAPMGDDDTTANQISHVICRGHFSRHPKNVAIPTMQIQCLNEPSRNYVRSC